MSHEDITGSKSEAGKASCCQNGKSEALPATRPTGPAAAAKTYTCPMHPQIRQEGPGSCPICGMALEPEVITLEEPENHELNAAFGSRPR